MNTAGQRSRQTLATLACVVGFSLPAAAEWRVSRMSGHAWLSQDGAASVDLAVGMTVPAAQTLVTGPGARVMLVRGTESMMVGPGSMVALSEKPEAGLTTTVLEKAGQVQFDVERRNVQHFSVETPTLAAVVKGTHFTVAVGRRDGSVAVSRGQVEVTALATGQRTDITPGMRATVGSHGLSVAGSGPKMGIVIGPPRAPVVAPLTTISPVATISTAELEAVATVAPAATAATTTAAASPAATSGTGSSANASQAQAARQPSSSSSYQPGALAALASALKGGGQDPGPGVSPGNPIPGQPGPQPHEPGPPGNEHGHHGRLGGLLGLFGEIGHFSGGPGQPGIGSGFSGPGKSPAPAGNGPSNSSGHPGAGWSGHFAGFSHGHGIGGIAGLGRGR